MGITRSLNYMKTICNNKIEISVKEHGAELASIRHEGREYLWQADEAFWKRHSPVLFPIVGAVWNGKFRSHGIAYKMGQHGFARDMDFSLIAHSDNELRYELVSNEETLKKYPYPFRLEIGYRLMDNKVRVMWHVENKGSETMAFQIGAHPAFFWPLLDNDVIEGGVAAMEKPLTATDNRGFFKIESTAKSMPISVITEGGCVGRESEICLDEDGYLPLDINTFNNDALIFENSQVTKVTLCDNDRKPYLSLEFTSPLVGLWSPPKKRAPFVCIEPWYGRTDAVGFSGSYEEKAWMQTLAPGGCFDAYYDIIIEE